EAKDPTEEEACVPSDGEPDAVTAPDTPEAEGAVPSVTLMLTVPADADGDKGVEEADIEESGDATGLVLATAAALRSPVPLLTLVDATFDIDSGVVGVEV
ncbi:hypothetical protein LTR28_000473, partial [Elasticomyces elasticus]